MKFDSDSNTEDLRKFARKDFVKSKEARISFLTQQSLGDSRKVEEMAESGSVSQLEQILEKFVEHHQVFEFIQIFEEYLQTHQHTLKICPVSGMNLMHRAVFHGAF
jgi:hypothetical protein